MTAGAEARRGPRLDRAGGPGGRSTCRGTLWPARPRPRRPGPPRRRRRVLAGRADPGRAGHAGAAPVPAPARCTPPPGARARSGRSPACRTCSAPGTTRAGFVPAAPAAGRRRTGCTRACGSRAPAWCWTRWSRRSWSRRSPASEARAGVALRCCSGTGRRRRARRRPGCGCRRRRRVLLGRPDLGLAPGRGGHRAGSGRSGPRRPSPRGWRSAATWPRRPRWPGCGWCRASGCGPRPRPRSARSATPTRCRSATSTSPTWSAGALIGRPRSTTRGCWSCWPSGRGTGTGWSG